MLPRTLSTISLLVLFTLSLEELSITTEQDVLNKFLTQQDTLLCFLIKNREANTNFDNDVHALSQLPRFRRNIAGVVRAPHNDQANYFSHIEQNQWDQPSVFRCFVGLGFKTAISSPQSTAQLSRWLTSLKRKMKQMWKYDINQLEVIRLKHEVVVIAFPTLAQLSTLDSVGKRVKETLRKTYSVAVVLIHPNSENASFLRAHLELPSHSSVLAVLSRSKKKERKFVFKGKDINTEKICVESFVQLSGIKHLSAADFEWEAMTVKRTERFRPYIVVFYAWWAKHAESYLRLMQASMEGMQALSIRARFALVNVAQQKTVMSRYIDVKYFKNIPFIAVFQREKGKATVNQTLIHLSHPSLFYLSKGLREHGVWLYDAWDKLWDYAPYPTLDYTHYCTLQEGPRGSLCTAWASNLTDSVFPKVITELKTKVKSRSQPSVERQMTKVKGIPLLTVALWDAAVEKSHIHSGSLHKEPDVHITVLAFIRDGCGSCNKKMETFKEIHKELQKKENACLFMVNCSSESTLCEDLNVQGFPTVSAFRSFATLASVKCSVHPPEKPYIRRDYHGPISTGDLIPWIESLAMSGVSFVGFTEVGELVEMVEDVRLVARVIPKFSNYLPLAPGGERNYFYSPRCLRLACERLFGLARCYIANSREIPSREFTKTNTGMSGLIVTEIVFERKDGVSLTLMRLGKSMTRLIEQETSSDLHLFHSTHQYSLGPKQTCEEDHDSCTQTIVSFVRDHLRLPVTQLTSEIFHTKNNPIFEIDKPVLIALSHAQNLSRTSNFMQLLGHVAKRLYHNVTVTVLDADQFPAWAGSFVPRLYPVLYMDSTDGGPLHNYPRICIVTWKDHKRAAFYPPLHSVFNGTVLSQLELLESEEGFEKVAESMDELEDVTYSSSWDEDKLVSYVKKYLENPDEYLVHTEHF